jgi:hypothetical protein
MSNRIKIVIIAMFVFAAAHAVDAQLPIPTQIAKSPNPELVGMLTKGLKIKPDQAIGGAGALFGMAKTKLSPGDFTKVADVVPGLDGLLGAAPKPAGGATDMLSSVGGMLPGKAGSIASMAGSFKSLGLSPDMAAKFVPIMSKYVQAKGGSDIAGLLTGVLK